MKRQVDLLNGPIAVSLAKLAMPIMATAMVQTAYGLIDMAWIGVAGTQAVAAVGAASMYVWLSQGVVTLAKMGGQIKVAHSLGEGKIDEARNYARGAIQIGVLLALIYGLICVLGSKPLIGFFDLQEERVVRQAMIYLQITCGCILFSFINGVFTSILTAIGDSNSPFIANVIGLVINIILDPLLIFGFGKFPGFGVAGAALATVFAQMVVTVVFLGMIWKEPVIFKKMNPFQKTSMSHIHIIVKLGFPAALQNLLYTSISMVLTRFVAGFGVAAVATQRVGNQIESLAWMTSEGFGTAINSFIGQNYGAGRLNRVKKGYLIAAALMCGWGIFCTILLISIPGPIFEIFIKESDVVLLGIDYLVILGFSQMFMCVELTTVGALSGLGKTLLCSVISITLTSARVPLAILLAKTSLGLNGIWWAFTISSVAKGILFFVCCIWIFKKLEGSSMKHR